MFDPKKYMKPADDVYVVEREGNLMSATSSHETLQKILEVAKKDTEHSYSVTRYKHGHFKESYLVI